MTQLSWARRLGLMLCLGLLSAMAGSNITRASMTPLFKAHQVAGRPSTVNLSTQVSGAARYGRPQKPAEPQAWQLRYFDDFSDPSSGWPIDDDPDRAFEYEAGEYRMYLKNGDYWAMVRAGPSLNDAAVEVDARFATNIYGTYGLLFGISDDWSQIFTFEVDERSTYRIWRWDWFQERWTLIRGTTFSEHINPRQAVNRLRVERIGSEVNFYANGEFLITEHLPAIAGERRMGIIAWTQGTPDMDIRFDNFAIYERTEAVPTSTSEPVPTTTPTLTVSQTPPQQPTPTATEITPGERLFTDDFSDPNSGWVVGQDETRSFAYQNGEYHIHLDAEGIITWGAHPGNYSDFDVRMKVRTVGELTGGGCGIVYRYTDSDNFYLLNLDAFAGSVLWRKRQNGVWSDLTQWITSTDIHVGAATNTVRIVAHGTLNRLYVNDHHLIDVSDDGLSEGQFALAVWDFSSREPSIECAFDDFEVYAISSAPPTTTPPTETPTVTPTTTPTTETLPEHDAYLPLILRGNPTASE